MKVPSVLLLVCSVQLSMNTLAAFLQASPTSATSSVHAVSALTLKGTTSLLEAGAVIVIYRIDAVTAEREGRMVNGTMSLHRIEGIHGEAPADLIASYHTRADILGSWSDYEPIWPDGELTKGELLLCIVVPPARDASAPDGSELPEPDTVKPPKSGAWTVARAFRLERKKRRMRCNVRRGVASLPS